MENRWSILVQAIADSASIDTLNIEWREINESNGFHFHDDTMTMSEKRDYQKYEDYLRFEMLVTALLLNKKIKNFTLTPDDYKISLAQNLTSLIQTRYPKVSEKPFEPGVSEKKLSGDDDLISMRKHHDNIYSQTTPLLREINLNAGADSKDAKERDENAERITPKDSSEIEIIIKAELNRLRPDTPKNATYCFGCNSDFEDLVMPKPKKEKRAISCIIC